MLRFCWPGGGFVPTTAPRSIKVGGELRQKPTHNTLWFLLVCFIGDFGTIAFFSFAQIPWLMTCGWKQSREIAEIG